MRELAETGEYEVFMFIPNMHALTEFHDGEGIRNNTINIVKTYIACGLDPEKTLLYNQSDVPGHTQLMRVLSCITNM